MFAALAIDCPTGALAPVNGTSSATRFCCASGNGAGAAVCGPATGGGAPTVAGRRTGVAHPATSTSAAINALLPAGAANNRLPP